jgi:hypothetical protein
MTKTHWMLSAGADFTTARDNVQNFFKKSILLSYDTVGALEHDSCSAEDERFWPELEKGLAGNHLVLREFLNELQAAGCREIDDLATLPLGYPSKVLHLIAHLLDGFIGIDSVFYNLVEDSHWLSAGLRETIRQTPSKYWLIRAETSFRSAEAASFIHLVKK